MIAKMSKYNFVLLAAQSEDFVARLRELGLVEITTTGWEPSEEDRQLILDIEALAKAEDYLARWAADEQKAALKGEPYASGVEAFEHFQAAQQQAAALAAEIARLEKTADELRPWGQFDVKQTAKLAEQGIVLHYLSTAANAFDKELAAWSEEYTIAEINRTASTVWFVVVTKPGEELSIDAQEMKAPQLDITEAEAQIAAAQAELTELDNCFARVKASEKLLKEYAASLKERLETDQISATATSAADGSLVVMEGWAEEATSEAVDKLLEEYPNVVYLKGKPTPEDNTPVKLKNNRFARIFEMIGDMYARPKYGTMDLTPFFAPFYMLFFGICLNDAGYGLILLIAGLVMLAKCKEGMMRRAAWFATMCALSTTLFGLFCGSLFGVNLGNYLPIKFFDFQGQFFTWALAIGMVQILFGLLLNVIMTIHCFGLKYAYSNLGWFIILLSGSLAAGLPMMNEAWTIPGFTASSPAFYGAIGVGLALLLLLNTPGKFHNPFLNIGSGLWNLYNNITGLLSDVLSYIRLFAIGLSGGVLAQVFNSLADGLSPDGNIVLKILVMAIILLIGHAINLFMSTISSFVHPMRLTFVEFYKNAGFEMASRNFEPLRKEN
ncbi:MAG: V-type ATPase 116kDa subunit family protein [Rikenellaceae bacterium]|nr:V-type ATPase 116kDa subunit family protein [Rikenellaceae bacterium]